MIPPYQKKGIGTSLVRSGLAYCRELGYTIVALIGHPNYYPHFGFTLAKQYGLDCEFEVPDEAWMVCELVRGALNGRKGTVYFQPQFREFA